MRKPGVMLISALCACACEGQLVLPGTVSEGMVLQRCTQASISGKAAPGVPVRVKTSWNNRSYKVVPASDSTWKVQVQTGEAGGPYKVDIRQGRAHRSISDVLLGEVWLCSGQSNMQMPLKGYDSQPVEGSLEEMLSAPGYSNVRLLHQPRRILDNPGVGAVWQKPTIQSAGDFSAIGWFFASRLSTSLGVPVGMIESDWGGTRIEAWMTAESVAKTEAGAAEKSGPDKSGVLYDNMIAPFADYSVRGFLWYQGESNKDNSPVYAELMAAMAKDWRKAFGGGEEMPFYYVMISPFQYTNGFDDSVYGDYAAPLLWEAQRKALDLITNSDIAMTTDLGDAVFIHPAKKKEVADRLLLLALHGTYPELLGEVSRLPWRGPVYKSVDFAGGKAVVSFDSPGTLCPVEPLGYRQVDGFEIAGADRKFYPADAFVQKAKAYGFSNKVIVSSPLVPKPAAVRYCFHNMPSGTLTNTLGLPALPFRTDEWELKN